MKEEALYGKIPFIWLVNQENHLVKAAVHNHWVVSCQERIDFWRFLNDWAGGNHQHQEVPAKEDPKEDRVNYEELKAAATAEAVNKLLETLLKD